MYWPQILFNHFLIINKWNLTTVFELFKRTREYPKLIKISVKLWFFESLTFVKRPIGVHFVSILDETVIIVSHRVYHVQSTTPYCLNPPQLSCTFCLKLLDPRSRPRERVPTFLKGNYQLSAPTRHPVCFWEPPSIRICSCRQWKSAGFLRIFILQSESRISGKSQQKIDLTILFKYICVSLISYTDEVIKRPKPVCGFSGVFKRMLVLRKAGKYFSIPFVDILSLES